LLLLPNVRAEQRSVPFAPEVQDQMTTTEQSQHLTYLQRAPKKRADRRLGKRVIDAAGIFRSCQEIVKAKSQHGGKVQAQSFAQ
jgi:hypothetical protein